jgi:chitinase
MDKVINGYWGGYFDSPLTLNKTPDYFNVVTLAFAGPDKNDTLTTDFLCSRFSKEIIIRWMKDLKKINPSVKILLSIIDNPTYHWNNVNLDIFTDNVFILINEWGLDGIDIDGQSGMSEHCFVHRFTDLTFYLRDKMDGGKILTYTCYTQTDCEVLERIKDKIDWINTMAYFDDYESMVNLYKIYERIVGDKICIGVKAGSKDDESVTPLNEVENLCKFNVKKKGIMLWTINRDTESFTGIKDLTWAKTIQSSLKIKSD